MKLIKDGCIVWLRSGDPPPGDPPDDPPPDGQADDDDLTPSEAAVLAKITKQLEARQTIANRCKRKLNSRFYEILQRLEGKGRIVATRKGVRLP